MDSNQLKQMYETALTIRRFEEAAIEQYRQGNIYGYLHPYLGGRGDRDRRYCSYQSG